MGGKSNLLTRLALLKQALGPLMILMIILLTSLEMQCSLPILI